MAVYEITKSCEKALDIYEEYPDVYEKNYIKKIEGQYRDIMFYTMKKKISVCGPKYKIL